MKREREREKINKEDKLEMMGVTLWKVYPVSCSICISNILLTPLTLLPLLLSSIKQLEWDVDGFYIDVGHVACVSFVFLRFLGPRWWSQSQSIVVVAVTASPIFLMDDVAVAVRLLLLFVSFSSLSSSSSSQLYPCLSLLNCYCLFSYFVCCCLLLLM